MGTCYLRYDTIMCDSKRAIQPQKYYDNILEELHTHNEVGKEK